MDPSFERDFLATFERAKGDPLCYLLQAIPEMEAARRLTHEFMELMFPGRKGDSDGDGTLKDKVHVQLALVGNLLAEQIRRAYHYLLPDESSSFHHRKAASDVEALCSQLPEIRQLLKLDAKAGFAGDPAASGTREIILSYPYMKALTVHRIAHVLYQRNVPLLPRMLSECAHQETGIDINPGAEIGKAFFIDHGTGVVIGETCVIGDNVKLYQGVTLGALSFPKNACGALIRGVKRHPTIEDGVTIYAHATILGDITIGQGAIIGAGVWIRENVKPNTMVTREEPKVLYRDLSKKRSNDLLMKMYEGLDFAQL